MTLILSGTDGLSDVDGSAATPAIRGTDTNTGIFFPAADTIAFSEGGVESMRLDSSGNVNVTAGRIRLGGGSDEGTQLNLWTTVGGDGTLAAFNILFNTGANNSRTERARIDSSGNLLVGKSIVGYTAVGVQLSPTNFSTFTHNTSGSTNIGCTAPVNQGQVAFYRIDTGALMGAITNGASNTVSYGTSSDYRLKEDIQPMTGALAKVSALKPVTWTWKEDGVKGEGFIAHEVQAIVPDAVTGEKDAVDAEGNPVYQGIDTSFLVATLTAAIQEQQTLIQSLTARIEALEGK